MQIINGHKYPIKNWASDLEDSALNQLLNLSKMPFIFDHIAVMPDAHAGIGSTVGTVIATKGAIIPAAVGVDIGCGMMAVRLQENINAFDNIKSLRNSIERSIPVGCNKRNKEPDCLSLFVNDQEKIFKNINWNNKSILQLGTLGGGNHFIELCHDLENRAWVVLHSGSRNIGKTCAEEHINRAKGLMKSYFIDLPDPDLSFLVQKSPEFYNYMSDLLWCQEYAFINRQIMMHLILKDISYHLYNEHGDLNPEIVINCHHNFSRLEHHLGKNVWITRKGAVSAAEGEWGIIPGSMGTKTYIVKGKGNIHSFHSCSHGAGRRMSRSQARKQFSQEELVAQTIGVECRKDGGVLDEIPAAYKDIDIVMENQKDLVDIIHVLKQIMCIKG